MLDFKEVTRTYTHDEAIKEASRCLNCKVPFCKKNGCPAGLRINEFIACLKNDDVNGAYEILMVLIYRQSAHVYVIIVSNVLEIVSVIR